MTTRTILLALLTWASALPLAAQIPDAGGTARVAELLRGLDGVKRVLVIAAHPDDEDTALLTALARGQGAEAAYLSLTRGEGGQNLIGPELFEGLGAIRTGELLAARRLDGARQFFTRAFDFGFSKNAEEALALWPRQQLLADVVWVVRTYRPQVIVSVFSGTPADGHGQHQAAGIMAREAFRAAGDPGRFPEQLVRGVEVWQPDKLYQLLRGRTQGDTTRVVTGAVDPVTGRSWFQIAMESRSQHRSQDMGVPQTLGPAASVLDLVRSAPDLEADPTLWAGVDTALTAIAGDAPAAAMNPLGEYRERIAEARSALVPGDPSSALPALLGAADALARARAGAIGGSTLRAELTRRTERMQEAVLAAASVVVDARASRDRLVPGETFRVDLEVWNAGGVAATDVTPSVALPAGARARPVRPPELRGRFGPPTADESAPLEPLGDWADAAQGVARTVEAGAFERWSFEVELPDSVPLSRLYYLERPRTGAMYQWPAEPSEWALPRDPERFPARVALTLAAEGHRATVAWEGAVDYRGVNPARGEYRQPVLILPALSVALDPGVLVWPLDRREPRIVNVTLESHAPDARAGRVRLEMPEGWTAEPEEAAFRLERAGSRATFAFQVVPPASVAEGESAIRALATVTDGPTYDEAVQLIDYEHIQRVALFDPARSLLRAFPVQVAQGRSVGYVMGTGDAGPAAIRELGIEPHLITTEDLASGDLGRFDVIVLGVRAYEARPDLIQYNETVLDWVRGGGVLISQYNQYTYNEPGIAPWPVEIRRPHDRVTDETAAVRFLEPDNPVLTQPNALGPPDFEGWVQERGLYFAESWDPRYQPVFRIGDPGEDPLEGSVLLAPVGEGAFVYTGLSFFRQLPAGVPGAYRLLANLLAWHP
ncbi:MAG: PIG-L family deacetylase [Gemmatimonadetes bacterium]|nr:PIG-L family deacetylase [Gemmatimonadota bacterium]